MFKDPTLFNYPLIIILAILLTNCKEASISENYNFEDYFPFSIGQNEFFAQIAISPKELNQGLMFRNHLDENHGMLFAFNYPKKVSFWMKNVPIPLDIGYFDSNGRLVEIYSLYPHDENPVFSKSANIQYALEMNKGWYRKNKIKTGSYIKLENVFKYVQLRKSSPYIGD